MWPLSPEPGDWQPPPLRSSARLQMTSALQPESTLRILIFLSNLAKCLKESFSCCSHRGWEFQALSYNSGLQLLINSHLKFSFMSTTEITLAGVIRFTMFRLLKGKEIIHKIKPQMFVLFSRDVLGKKSGLQTIPWLLTSMPMTQGGLFSQSSLVPSFSLL